MLSFKALCTKKKRSENITNFPFLFRHIK
jgi:hypothetical protein